MKTTLLDYTKLILSKVSFCEALFEKELRKNLYQLSDEEKQDLQGWCKYHFGVKYNLIIDRCFDHAESVHKMAC
jgi:predicted 3-demethylubiquinone-9 3-methyltransferase (glyoxalase superfamily)